MPNEMKSCPFCGSEAEVVDCGRIVRGKYIPFFRVRCKECWTHYPKYYHTREEAIEVWNRRSSEDGNAT